ncbi:LysR family transcriptional regulator [Prauserella cavernicola]|uniref:LysR family transcriptional regulator n=1 Tax=Prauserella cavernicola TaxID=2800127 RepID=A0A934QX80_9PSEU|nr:LysR family transcriptional regulator [Prauserella cavernicola]MBK1787817.1 LysR family transcriptional regulator [Prauserella cavernicola]
MTADDLRYFLSVARHGRLARAAEELGVDHTTVGRRLTTLERELGQRLFDRKPSGWVLTEPGQLLVEPAEKVAAAVVSAHELLGGRGAELQGNVRVLTPDSFGAFLLAPALSQLRQRHPALTIEMVTATVHLSQSVRTFDVAVTLEQPTSPRVQGRFLSAYKLGLYATEDYLGSRPPITTVDDLSGHGHTMISYVEQLLDVVPLRRIHDALPSPAQIQSTNIFAQWQAAAAGVGIAALPKFIAEPDARLRPVLPELEFEGGYWLVLPREHVRLARVHAVIGAIDEMITDRQRDLLGLA